MTEQEETVLGGEPDKKGPRERWCKNPWARLSIGRWKPTRRNDDGIFRFATLMKATKVTIGSTQLVVFVQRVFFLTFCYSLPIKVLLATTKLLLNGKTKILLCAYGKIRLNVQVSLYAYLRQAH